MEYQVPKYAAFRLGCKTCGDIGMFGKQVERPTDGCRTSFMPGEKYGDDFITDLSSRKGNAVLILGGKKQRDKVVPQWHCGAALDEVVYESIERGNGKSQTYCVF